jgi:hypothetical protein
MSNQACNEEGMINSLLWKFAIIEAQMAWIRRPFSISYEHLHVLLQSVLKITKDSCAIMHSDSLPAQTVIIKLNQHLAVSI